MVERATGRLLYHDPASRAYAAPRRVLAKRSWLHRYGPVLDQGMVNGCVGWSAADFLNAAIAHGNRRIFNEAMDRPRINYLGDPEGRKLYELSTQADPFRWTFPPTDNGSSGLGALKALKSLGVIERYLWTFDFEQLLAWGQRQPVLVGTLWTDAMGDPDRDGIIHIGTEAQIKRAVDSGMGHEYTLRGVNWPRKLARIRNHWSEEWGIAGDALLPLDELERLVIDYQGDVAVPELAAA
ncbi:cysteine protease [Mycobacterium phage PenguinLover67]|nr:cysteine protease [Mycobacterium phage PenguinLover67]